MDRRRANKRICVSCLLRTVRFLSASFVTFANGLTSLGVMLSLGVIQVVAFETAPDIFWTSFVTDERNFMRPSTFSL